MRAQAPSDEDMEVIKQAFHDWNVVFFREQFEFDNDAHLRFAKLMGTPDVHPIVKGIEGHPEIMRVRACVCRLSPVHRCSR